MRLREYETVCIFKPYTSPDVVEKCVQKVLPYIKEGGGELLHNQVWGRKKLAYLIKKEREGLYVALHFVALSSQIAGLEKILFYDESVLKFLTIKMNDNVANVDSLKKINMEVPSIFRPDPMDNRDNREPREVRADRAE